MVAGAIVMVMWVPAPGAVKYGIYLNDAKVGEAVAPPFQFPVPEKGGEYKVEVVSLDAGGGESPRSAPGKFKVVKLEAPRELSAMYDPEKKNTRLRWNPPQGAVIYNVFRAEKEGDPGTLLLSTQEGRYTDSNLQAGRKYFYSVTAKDITGKESDRSNVAVVDTKETEKAAAGTETTVGGKKLPKLVPIPAKLVGTATMEGSAYSIAVLPDNRIAVQNDGMISILAGIEDPSPSRLGDLSGVMGLRVDRRGNLLAAMGNANRIVTLDPATGAVLKEFTLPALEKELVSDGQKRRIKKPFPYAAVELPNGNYAVTDPNNSRVVILGPDGKFIAHAGEAQGKHIVQNASYLSASDNGTLYVVAGIGNQVHVFDGNGKFLDVFGETGNIVGSFARIQDVIVDPQRNVWVSDMVNANVQKFDPNGESLGVVSNEEGKGGLTIFNPAGIAFTKDGYLLVAETMGRRVRKFQFVK